MKRLALFLLSFLFSAFLFAAPLNKIIVFGDSLSDNGNLYEYLQHQLPPSPPYYKGHFSNGPIWVEYLAKAYFPDNPKEHLLDYAFGGAGIMSEEDDDGILFTLNREIDSYLVSHNDKADPNSLFVVWIGGNNYLADIDDSENNFNMVQQGIKNGITKLLDKGARHVLVIGLPDLGKSPFAKDNGIEQEMSYFCNRHNRSLEGLVAEIKAKQTDAQILYFDVAKFVDRLLLSPDQFGFTNVSETCYEAIVGKHLTYQGLLKMASQLKAKSVTTNCEGYLFFDPVHPTSLAHKLVAEQIFIMLKANGVGK